jgi:hypothetical protein
VVADVDVVRSAGSRKQIKEGRGAARLRGLSAFQIAHNAASRDVISLFERVPRCALRRDNAGS